MTRYLSEVDNSTTIELRLQRNGTELWVVVSHGSVLNKDGEWESEPLPSARNRDFIKRTRFTLDEAIRRARDVV